MLVSLAAQTYYVAPSGSDAASGTSPAGAWKTLQHAADLVGPGDTVIALPGHYAGFYLSTSGTSAAPITFTANPGADVAHPLVVVDANNAVTPDRINLEGASWVVVEGFTVIGSGDPATNRTGIRTVLAEHVTIRANRIDQCGRWGILTGFVDDVVIEDNEASRSADEHGIYVSNSGDRPIVRRNRIWGNHSNGLHMNGDASLGGDGVISDALVERNVIWENGDGNPIFGPPGGSAINCDGVQDALIQNNLLYANHKSGISLYRIDGGGGSNGNRVLFNTVHMAAGARFALNVKDGSVGNTVANNVLLNLDATRGAIDIESNCLAGFACDFNALEEKFSLDGAFLTFAQWKAATGQDAHSFLAQPAQLFGAWASGDYHLLAAAPAVNAATSAQPTPFDLDGKQRPALGGFDLGAYEHAACFGAFASYGAGLAGSGGKVPALSGSGCPDQGATATLVVSNGLGGAPGALVLGSGQLALPLLGGTLLTSVQIAAPHVLTPAGTWSVAFGVPVDPSLAGVDLFAQSGYVDAGAAQGVSLSAGLRIELE
ncbi:MAG: hypothetical protein EPO68_07150 [Planctomycetota bacterium]|nr:MAG: hypothetical protein EPO68_07150 [Planctomycetota bacterium]